MKARSIVLVCVAATVTLAASGGASASPRWIPFEGASGRVAEAEVVSSDLTRVSLRVGVPGVRLEEVLTKGGEFVRFSLPSCGYAGEAGEALLPTVREYVEIPWGAEPLLRVVSADVRTVSLERLGAASPIVPAQPSVEKIPGALEEAEFVLSREYYARDRFDPPEIARVGGVRTLRGHRYVLLEINPIRYNPARGVVEYATSIEIEIEFRGADPEATARAHARYASPPFDHLTADLFLNGGAFGLAREFPLPIGYLIIAHESLVDEISLLAEWKHGKGHETTVISTADVPGGNTRENIRALIQDAYDNWDVPPTFVLLVGDTDLIEHWEGTQSDAPATDLYYVTMDGPDDWDPDIAVGRFSCTTALEVTNLVSKTVDYERYDLASGTDWLKKAVFMASCDNHTVSEGTHNHVIETYLDPRGYVSDRLYCTLGATTEDVSAALNDGRSLCVFSGHGSTTSWVDGPPFDPGDVLALTNTDMLPLVHSYACLTGAYDLSCFGETWINASDSGGLFFWGSSVTSYWGEDDILERGAFEALFDEGYTWACGIGHRALYHVLVHYGAGGNTHRYFEMYNVLGDPGVEIWTDVPSQLEASYADAIPIGLSSLGIAVSDGRAPVADALVCIEGESGNVYGTAYTNDVGQATVALDAPPSVPGTLDITVTKHDRYPHEGSVTVTGADMAYCRYFDHAVDDDLSGGSAGNGDGNVAAGETIELVLTLENAGTAEAQAVAATLFTSDPHVAVTDDYEEYGDIAAGGTAGSLEDYDFSVDGACPDGHEIQFAVEATDGAGTWVSYFGIEVGAPNLILAGFDVDDAPPEGNGDGCPGAGESIVLTVELRNVGSEPAQGVAAQLSTADPYVTVGGGSASAAVIPAGGTASLEPGYELTILQDAPDLHVVELELALTTGTGYVGDLPLVLVLSGDLEEDFDSSGQDWSHSSVSLVYVDQWHVDGYRYHSSRYSWKFGGPGAGHYAEWADGALETPPLCLGFDCELSFWHWLETEEVGPGGATDCAVLEISTDGGETWSLIVPEGGYTHAVAGGTANPLPPGTPCWSGSHSWRQEVFDLAQYAGSTAVVRFRFGSNEYGGGEGWYVDDVAVTCSSTGIDGDVLPDVPGAFALFQNAPNPFNPVTTIGYAVAQPSHVTLRIYNVAGSLVRTLVDARREPGVREVVWDGTNERGERVGSGVYFCRMTAGEFVERRLLVLVK